MRDCSNSGGTVAQATAMAADRVASADGRGAFLVVVAAGVISPNLPAPDGVADGPSAQLPRAVSSCWGRV